MGSGKLSQYLCFLLRHHPETLSLDMDEEGYVDVDELIRKVNLAGRYHLTHESLEGLVQRDHKGRYRFTEDHSRIRAVQGHSIPWVKPPLLMGEPPEILYHGTTAAALKQIRVEGIRKMERHAVHMQADERKAWLSALRWTGQEAVVLKIDAKTMSEAGYTFGMADNGVWCTEYVPFQYVEVLTRDSWAGH